jgi:hypothetical protein
MRVLFFMSDITFNALPNNFPSIKCLLIKISYIHIKKIDFHTDVVYLKPDFHMRSRNSPPLHFPFHLPPSLAFCYICPVLLIQILIFQLFMFLIEKVIKAFSYSYTIENTMTMMTTTRMMIKSRWWKIVGWNFNLKTISKRCEKRGEKLFISRKPFKIF